jgi:TetR/AcrR family hemagglutinin/protease transcriptional regulator
VTDTIVQPAPRKRLSRTKRRQQVLDFALVAFARDGIGRAGHTQIAELAGVSVPTVFKYFPTRVALLGAVLGKVERHLLKLVREAHADTPSVHDAFHAHIHAWMRLTREETDIFKIWLEWSASIRDDIWPRYLKFESRVLEILVKTLDRDPAPRHMKNIDIARVAHGVAYMSAHMIFSPNCESSDVEEFMLQSMDHIVG